MTLPRVIAITLAQLLLHNNNRSHLVHTAGGQLVYQQTFKLRTVDRYNSGESDSRSTLEPGCTIAHALTLTGNCIPEHD